MKKTNQKFPGYPVRVMNAEELEIHEAGVDVAIANAEPLIVRSQFKRAVERLEERLEKLLAEDGAQAGRALLEKMALIAGDRRMKTLEVECDRRQS